MSYINNTSRFFGPMIQRQTQTQNQVSTGAHRNGPTVNHTNDYKIVLVLDESGSMNAISQDMVRSINDLIREQRTINRPCKFTLVKFNNHIQRVVANRDLNEVSLLDSISYTPNGSTALYDAIGDTIDWFRYEENVLLVIVTDGNENASQIYSHKEIKDALQEKNRNRGWTYVYLANDLSVAKQGDSLGCQRSAFSSNCQVNIESYGDFVSNDLNSAIKKSRIDGTSVQSVLNLKY